MELTSLASAMANAQVGGVRMALAARMLKMNADAKGAIAQVLDAAQQNMQRLTNAAAGVGQHLDISV
jgi:hypothetical protein